jgi:hypothetical protein
VLIFHQLRELAVKNRASPGSVTGAEAIRAAATGDFFGRLQLLMAGI